MDAKHQKKKESYNNLYKDLHKDPYKDPHKDPYKDWLLHGALCSGVLFKYSHYTVITNLAYVNVWHVKVVNTISRRSSI